MAASYTVVPHPQPHHPYLLYSGRTTHRPLCGPEYMGGPHRASSGNCMVRAVDIKVCGRAACSRRQREKRDAKSGELWPLGSDTRARDRGHGFWPVPTEGCCGVQTLEAVHMVARGCLVVMMQRLCAKRFALIGPYLQTPYLHQNCDLPSPASDAVHSSGRARAARGQQCGTIYWQTGRVCLQPGGLPCGSRPPPQIKGSKRLDAASTDTKGQGKRPPHLTCSTNFSQWRLGAGYEGALSLIFVMPTVCDRATTRRVAWSR